MTPSSRLWAVDKLLLAYCAFTSALILGWWREVPGAAGLMAVHAVAVSLLLFEAKLPNPTSWAFRHWYPLPYVAACYREMAILIPPIRARDFDTLMSRIDYRFWGVHPSVWLERIQTTALTEYLQIVYTAFIPAVLLVAYLLWRGRRYHEFQYYAFLIAGGFLASYIGYLLVPVRGPRFLLADLQHIPLRGGWFFHSMRSGLDSLESAHYDCFPSGHTELTILAWWSTRKISNRLFWAYFAYTLSIIFATVYLRYHYSVDLLAGAVLAVVLLAGAPSLFRRLGGGSV